MLSPDNIKRGVRKRQIGCVALLKGNQRFEAEPPREVSSNPAVISAQIKSGDMAAERIGNIPGCTSEAAADIKNLHVSFNPEILSKSNSCLATTGMKFVNRDKIIKAESVRNFAGSSQGMQNFRTQIF